MRPDAAAWRVFFVRLLQGAGTASLGAGVIFFVAANWQDYGLMGRFAILQGGLLATTGVAIWRPPPHAWGASTLVLAVLVTGALLALFGQSYQTGADVHELFFTWAALTLAFALAGASGAVWATWWVVLDIGLALYCSLDNFSLMRLAFFGRLGVDRSMLLLLAGLVNLAGAAAFTFIGPRWLVRMLGTFGFAFATVACIVGMFQQRPDGLETLVLAVVSAALAYWALRSKTDVFPMALIFASWIAISTAFFIKQLRFEDVGPFFLICIWLIAASTAAGFLLMRWVREWKGAA